MPVLKHWKENYETPTPIPTPTGKYMDAFIMQNCPYKFFTDAQLIADGSHDLSTLDPLLGTQITGKRNLQSYSKYQSLLALVKYTILEFYPDTCHALVKYYRDDCLDGITLNVGLPLQHGQHPDPTETDMLIRGVAPAYELDKIVTLASYNPVIPDHLQQFVVTKEQLAERTKQLMDQITLQQSIITGNI
jgi:hypothetical protein